ncbi:MAG: hypothetical protein FWF49_06705 [Oscillospiraceae bacterium]|nr:hypothetical protein [Oscillospiraceae bacterium]
MTPLIDALNAHAALGRVSLHTPGHKGAPPFGVWDVTELPDTGSLFGGVDDAIARAETQAAAAFGAGATLFSAGGDTLCIQTMLALAMLPGGAFSAAKEAAGGMARGAVGGVVAMSRNAHISAVNAAVLLDLGPVWFDGTVDGLLNIEGNIQAVYVTSPTYEGRLLNVEGLCKAAHTRGVPVLVDNAHGSHLGAFGLHPLQLGAAMSADSTHKTLPVRTGGAYLHLSEAWCAKYAGADEAGAAKENLTIAAFDVKAATAAAKSAAPAATTAAKGAAKSAMALFGSTSPSFETLASLDFAQDWWVRGGAQAYRELAARLPAHSGDPARLCVKADAARLRAAGFEPEMEDGGWVTLILTPFNTAEEIGRLLDVIQGCPLRGAPFKKGMLSQNVPPSDALSLPLPGMVLSPRQAYFSQTVRLPLEQAVGRVAARAACPCPPGIAVLVPGARIDEGTARWLVARSVMHADVVAAEG